MYLERGQLIPTCDCPACPFFQDLDPGGKYPGWDGRNYQQILAVMGQYYRAAIAPAIPLSSRNGSAEFLSPKHYYLNSRK